MELQNCAAEIKLRAERKAGKLLKALKLRGGDRKSKGYAASLKLDDLGISRDQSKRWQHVASVSDTAFASYLKRMSDERREITSAGLLRIAVKGQKAPRNLHMHSKEGVPPDRPEHLAAEEMLEELVNHCKLLGDILRPVYEEAELDLKRGEKRVIGRLIGEMTHLIVQLRKTWHSTTALSDLNK